MKPTLEEAKNLTDAKYNLQDSLEQSRSQRNTSIVLNYQIAVANGMTRLKNNERLKRWALNNTTD